MRTNIDHKHDLSIEVDAIPKADSLMANHIAKCQINRL